LGLISPGGFAARTAAKYIIGCDVVAVGSYVRDLETRFWNEEPGQRKCGAKSDATRKAAIALMGVLENYPTTFKRVSFVYLTTCNVADSIDHKCQIPHNAGGLHKTLISELIITWHPHAVRVCQ